MLFSKKIKSWAIMLFSLLMCCNLASAQTSAQTKAAPDAIKVETLLLEGKTLGSCTVLCTCSILELKFRNTLGIALACD